MKKKDVVLFYGPLATERTYKERGLITWCAPCSNRMRRLGQSLRVSGCRCFIISPAISLRVPAKRWCHYPVIEHLNGVPIVSLGQFGAKYLGFLLSPLTACLALRKIMCRHRVTAIMQYVYYPDALLISLVGKMLYGCRIILDLEDVCVPCWADWKLNSGVRPVQQLIGSLLMKASLLIADVIIVPTSKFMPYTKRQISDILLVKGCQPVADCLPEATYKEGRAIKILFGGAFVFEHGIHLLAEALCMLKENSLECPIEVHTCGSGNKVDWFVNAVKDVKNIPIHCHGYLSNREFCCLFESIDVCCVLQNPQGRYGTLKTPSKGYEALCSGKTIIVSDIGDFQELPDDICYHLHIYTAEGLKDIITSLTLQDVITKRESALHYAKKHWDSSIVGAQILQKGIAQHA